jgi:hypothetical protein
MKASKFMRRKANTSSLPLQNFTQKKTRDSQNDKKKNQRVPNFKILQEKTLKVHKSKTPPPFHNKKNLKKKIEDPKL